MTTGEAKTNSTVSNPNMDSMPNPYNINIHGWLKAFLILLLVSGIWGITVLWVTLKGTRLDYDSLFLYTALFQTFTSFIIVCYIVYSFFKIRCNAVFMGKAFVIINLILSLVLIIFFPMTSNSIWGIAGNIVYFLYLTYSQQVNDIFPKGYRKALRRDYYIIAAYILLPIIFFWGTLMLLNYEEKIEILNMTKEEKEQAINTLSLYALPVDSAWIQDEIAKAKANNTADSEEDFDLFYLNNMVHLDSVVKQGIELARFNEVKELLNLLEKERMNFYAHPSNEIDNEIALINLFLMLYSKTEETEQGFYSKLIPLTEFASAHIQMIQAYRGGEIHPYYPEILLDLTKLYSYTSDYEKAIKSAKDLCNCYEELNDTTKYTTSLAILTELYEYAEMLPQRDSCQKILDASPIYQEFLKSMQENDTTGMYQ